MKIKEIYRKYINYIVICLTCLFILKSCHSCTVERRCEFQKNKYEYVVDSLSKRIDKYEDSLRVYSIELKNLKESNNTLRGINKHFQNTNRTLVNTNKELTINKDKE